MSPLRSLAESQEAGVSWSALATLLLSTGWMIPWVLKLPSWAASSTTTSGRLWAVAAAVSLVSKSVRVKKGSILIPVFLVNASKIAWYALGESFAPRAQTRNGPEASALAGPGPLPGGGLGRDVQRPGQRGVGQPVGDQQRDLAFPGRQRGRSGDRALAVGRGQAQPVPYPGQLGHPPATPPGQELLGPAYRLGGLLDLAERGPAPGHPDLGGTPYRRRQ